MSIEVGDFVSCGCGGCPGTSLYRVASIIDGYAKVVDVAGAVNGDWNTTDGITKRHVLTPAQQLAWKLGVEVEYESVKEA